MHFSGTQSMKKMDSLSMEDQKNRSLKSVMRACEIGPLSRERMSSMMGRAPLLPTLLICRSFSIAGDQRQKVFVLLLTNGARS